MPSHPIDTIERLRDAMNRHDLDAFVACFAPDYRSEQPNHPNRAFSGSHQVRRNWSTMFESMPDFRAELLRAAEHGDTVWSEWHWYGTLRDGTPKEIGGVILAGIQNDRIAWGRLYTEDIETGGGDIDAAMDRFRRPG
ncbi:MAG TPA: nuclear transport factor 2 family protein [Candidatus Limnocylindrales bacterium]|nr:nuclear transport factor 2 family protein [Candidatus Limnocylindrales bacterium]